jgi:hypothetical protein
MNALQSEKMFKKQDCKFHREYETIKRVWKNIDGSCMKYFDEMIGDNEEIMGYCNIG